MQIVQTYSFGKNNTLKSYKKLIAIVTTCLFIILSAGCGSDSVKKSKGRLAYGYIGNGIKQFNKDNNKQAISFFEKEAKRTPEDYRPWIWIGRVHLYDKNYDAANTAYRKSIELSPNQSLSHVSLGIALYNQKRNTEAEAEIIKGLKLSRPSMWWSLYNRHFLGVMEPYVYLGILSNSAHKYKEAAEYFEYALAITKGGTRYERSFYTNNRSRRTYLERVHLHQWTAVHWWLGVANENLGKIAKARQFYQKSVDLGYSSGTDYLTKMEINTCKKIAGKGQTQKKISKGTRKLLVQAKVLMKAKKYDKAIVRLYKVVDVAPWLLIARNNLALVEAAKENYGSAIIQMKCYLILNPNAKNAQKAQDKIDGWEALIES